MQKNIFVIDDDALVVKSIKALLKKSGYGVITAQSGKEALALVVQNKIDLIISDIRMPEMDGMEALRKIRESGTGHRKAEAPAIVIIGYAGSDDAYKDAEELGIAEFLYKPFELIELAQAIKKNLELSAEIKNVLPQYEALESGFILLVEEMREYVAGIKKRFDDFDRENTGEQKQISFIEESRKEVFAKLDDYFARVWQMVKDFEKEKYLAYQNYYQQMLHPFFEEGIEINTHIYRKPLGYPGDYMIMNYIYEYNGSQNYLGKTAYEKLINNYTCNISISCSNISRKDFLKARIIAALEAADKPKILSIACGPARELLELLDENKIIKPLSFKCLDLEKKALNYINEKLKTIPAEKKKFLSIGYIHRDITSIIRDEKLKAELRGQDLIYVFGIFDYLGERMAVKITQELFQLLNSRGKLIICNISLENSAYRAYYEFLGEWNMVYRTKEEMPAWTKKIEGVSAAEFEPPSDDSNYLFLCMRKG